MTRRSRYPQGVGMSREGTAIPCLLRGVSETDTRDMGHTHGNGSANLIRAPRLLIDGLVAKSRLRGLASEVS